MRRVLKWLGIGVAGLFGLAVLGYGVLLVINWPDEPVSETAQAYLDLLEELREPPLEGNGFFYLAGMTAASDEDPWDLAREWREWMELPTSERLDTDEPLGPAMGPDSEWIAGLHDYAHACRAADVECIELLEAEYEAVRRGLMDAAPLFDRYELLMGLPLWREQIVDDVVGLIAMTSFTAINLSRMNGIRAWVLAKEGETEAALGLMEQEASFWRDVLAGKISEDWIWSIPWVLRNNLSWTNQILSLQQHELETGVPSAWQVPLSQAERDMRVNHAVDVSRMLNILDDYDTSGFSLWHKLQFVIQESLYQPRATANRLAEYYEKVDETMRLPYPGIRQALDEISTEEREQGRLFHLYNPIGNMLYEVSIYSGVIPLWFGVNDLEGARRALLLAHELRTEGVAPEDVAAYLEDASLRDPYTGEAFTWDAEAGAISYQGMGRRPYSFPLAYPGI